MDSQLLERICSKLEYIVSVLNDISYKLDECNTMERIIRRRQESLEHYRREYERQHGVIEVSSDCEDEID